MELIGLIFLSMPFVVACAIGLALPLVAVLSYGRLVWGLALIASAMLADVLVLSAPIMRVGITLFVADVPMVLLGIVAAWRWMARDDVPRRDPAWLLLVAVFGVGLAIGLARHGTAAGVAARTDFYALAAASYAMSFPVGQRELRQLFRVITWAAGALLLLTVYRWTVFYLPIRELLPYGGLYNNDGEIRVVWANAALVMAECALLGAFFGRAGGPLTLARWLAAPLLAGVLVLQHRSVWLAAVVGVVVALLLAGRQRASRFQQALLLLALVVASVLPLSFSDRLAGQFNSSVTAALAGQGTVHARLENWRVTLQTWADHGPLAIAIGDEPGLDKARVVETEAGELRRISFSAHNHYVSLLTGTGVLGLLAYLWVVLQVVRGLIAARATLDDDRADGAALLLLVAMQLAYFVSYGSDFLQFALFGVALSWAAGHRMSRPTRLASAPLAGRSRSAAVAANVASRVVTKGPL